MIGLAAVTLNFGSEVASALFNAQYGFRVVLLWWCLGGC